MKTNIQPTPHDNSNLSALPPADKSAVRHTYKLGLDVDLRNLVVAFQCDHGAMKPAQKFSRPRLLAWIKEHIAAGHAVHTVYECCGFGYTLHEELCAAGAQSLITTPLRLSLERRRKNDRLDARELCVRLSRYRDGHTHELRPIRIPSRAEVQRRELGRQREFWKRELRRLENHGRALRIEHEHETLPAGWAGPRKWKQLAKPCSAFVREQLEPLVQAIRHCKAQLDRLTEQIEARVATWDHGGLVLTDVWGGSCHQCGASAARGRGEVVVVTGLNLPTLIDYLHNRDQHSPVDLAERLLRKGQESIRLQRGLPA